MGHLTGQYLYSIDTKGRIVIPSEFKEILGDKFFLVRGLEKCLTLYSAQKWNELVAKLSDLPMTDPYARSLLRFYGSGVREIFLDSGGRMTIPPAMREHAALCGKSVFVGVFNKAELWSEENWNNLCRNDYRGNAALSDEFCIHIRELSV